MNSFIDLLKNCTVSLAYILSISLICLLFSSEVWASSTGTTAILPYESWLITFQKSMTGPVAFSVAILGIVGSGFTLIFVGAELNRFIKSVIYLIMVMTCLIGANALMSDLFNGASIGKVEEFKPKEQSSLLPDNVEVDGLSKMPKSTTLSIPQTPHIFNFLVKEQNKAPKPLLFLEERKVTSYLDKSSQVQQQSKTYPTVKDRQDKSAQVWLDEARGAKQEQVLSNVSFTEQQPVFSSNSSFTEQGLSIKVNLAMQQEQSLLQRRELNFKQPSNLAVQLPAIFKRYADLVFRNDLRAFVIVVTDAERRSFNERNSLMLCSDNLGDFNEPTVFSEHIKIESNALLVKDAIAQTPSNVRRSPVLAFTACSQEQLLRPVSFSHDFTFERKLFEQDATTTTEYESLPQNKSDLFLDSKLIAQH